MSKLTFEVPNYYHLAPRNYGKAKYEYPQVIDYLENEIHRLYLIIDKAKDILNIKQARYYNEKDYELNDEDLDEIMKILDGVE